MPDAADLLADFSPPQPYTRGAADRAPRSPGVHVVLERGVVLYVGRTKNLRDRLRQHLTGDRIASVLHEQVGHEIDKRGIEATASDVADWLAQREVRWHETDNPEAAKDALVLALKPRFNRQIPK